MGPRSSSPGEHRSPREAVARQLDAARRAFVAEIAAGRGDHAAHHAFSEQVDRIVVGAAPGIHTLSIPVVLCAIGGYGRGALCLHSDIDLLIVFGTRVGAEEERLLSALLHPLWDAHLTVGYQVRTIDELERIEDEELEDGSPELTLALLDARFLAGDPRLFDRVQARFGVHRLQGHASTLKALCRLTDARHAQFNDTIYQLEPDVKSSPGGLRDVVVTRLLSRLARGVSPPADAALEAAEGFLLRVRSILHHAAGRNANVLSRDLQEQVAARLSGGQGDAAARPEALMRAYFAHARAVAGALRRARSSTGSSFDPSQHVPAGPNLERAGTGIRFVDEERAGREPSSWLGAFEAALERNVAVADSALAVIARRVAACTFQAALPTREDRHRFARWLTPRDGLYAQLSTMRDCGLLDCLLPGFAAISCRSTDELDHKYTVDQHTLLAIRAIERLLTPDSTRERFRSLLQEIRFPERLVLALLSHDVGKWNEDDHVAESVRFAHTMCDRLELDDDTRQHIEFLVGQHLAMAHVAFRSDSEDPAVIQRFAALVGSAERLKMLCVMTLADIQAFGTSTLTPSKEELLWRLYVKTHGRLTRAYGDEVIEHGHAAMAAVQATRPPDVSEQELTAFLEGFPQRYLVTVDSSRVYQHARLARNIHRDEVHLFLEQKGTVWELAVVTLDKPLLFSNICGTLSYCGLDILRGSAMTSARGVVLDILEFSDDEGAFGQTPGASMRLERLLQDVVAGRQEITALLREKQSGPLYGREPRRIAPVVRFDAAHSQNYTILEIVAQDAPGLLHRISRVISQHGCNVDLVLIATEGDKAVDLFHVTSGAAGLAEGAQLALAQDLVRMLEAE
jgi:[protein-PII] uridylyltransferase